MKAQYGIESTLREPELIYPGLKEGNSVLSRCVFHQWRFEAQQNFICSMNM